MGPHRIETKTLIEIPTGQYLMGSHSYELRLETEYNDYCRCYQQAKEMERIKMVGKTI